MKHSTVVGGSTAARVMACPASVKLCAAMPPKQGNVYTHTGTLLHDAIAAILDSDKTVADVIGQTYEGVVLTEELADEKLRPAITALAEIDPDMQLEYAVEQTVSFGKVLPGAFGSTDLIGKLGRTTIVLDWKFGDGVPVDAEENEQLMYYADAARLTKETKWAFEDTDEIELIIVQPPHVRRWTTTHKRLDQFRRQLRKAVKLSQQDDAPFKVGEHCRFCAGKPLCPMMTGAAERALQTSLENLDGERIGRLVTQAALVEQWIKDLRELAQTMLENDKPVAGYKLVQKRAVRKWVDETVAAKALQALGVEPYTQELLSPAAAEKVLKKSKQALPDDLVTAVSSGSTLVPEDDPRPAVLNIGRQLSLALNKLS